MRVAVIGDVHGHREELVKMLNKVERHQVDRIVLLGDLVDRGPDSPGCLRVARKWQFRARNGRLKNLEVVQGNHEDAYVRHYLGLPKPGHIGVARPGNEWLAKRLSYGDLQWMCQLRRYIWIEQLGVLLIHGGVLPRMTRWDDLDAHVLRVRYLDARGETLPWTASSPRFWADDYDGRFGFIVFGHESWREPCYFPNAIGIDGHTFNKVHAVILSDERSGLRISKTMTVDYAARNLGWFDEEWTTPWWESKRSATRGRPKR